ncbi:MAG TPA: hypothetical protein VF508_10590 [Pyrinomonadaceae bacterium]|jgi:hypothetical protein
MVASWKAQGTLAEELNKRLEGFSIAGEEAAQTMDGLTSNLQEALNVFSAEATGRAFDALKAEFARLLPQLFDFKSAGISGQFKALASLADDVLVRLVRIGGEIAQSILSGLRQASAFVERNRGQIDGVLNQLGGMARLLIQIVGVFGQLATSSATWGSSLGVVRSVLGLINTILAAVLIQLRQMAPTIQLLILGANAWAMMTMGGLAGAGAANAASPPREQETGFSAVRLNPDGSLASQVSLDAPRAGGGKSGGKGGGGRKSRVPELQRELNRATIEAELAEVQARFALIRQDIAASVDAIRDGLDDALISISEAYRLEAALADKALRSEQERINAEINAAKQRRDLAVDALDSDLTPAERRLAIAAEDKKLTAETTRLEGERKRLIEETADKQAALVRDEARAQKQLADSLRSVEAQLDSMSRSSSVRAAAAVAEIEARFEETRRQLVANFGEASEQVQALDRLISNLGQRATFQEVAANVEAKFAELRDLEALLSVGVESGQIRAKDATRRRLELEREYKRILLDEIGGLAEIARRTGDPALQEAVRKLQIEWSKLGVEIDATAKRIDDTLRSGLEDTLASIITRTETVGEAFRKLATTILAEIARIVAVNLVEKIFGGILQTNAQGTSIGGILAGIFGGGTPKTSGVGARPGAGIENLPLVIKDYDRQTGAGLRGVNETTQGVREATEGGFGATNSNLGTIIDLIGNLGAGSKAGMITTFAQIGLKFAGTLLGGIGGGGGDFGGGGAGGGWAAGGRVAGAGTGTSDSILARLSNGEFVIREWAVRQVGPQFLHFLNNFGRPPEVPQPFAVGGPVGFTFSDIEPPARGEMGTTILQQTNNFHGITDLNKFKQSEQQIKRDLGRAAQQGLRRAQSTPRG